MSDHAYPKSELSRASILLWTISFFLLGLLLILNHPLWQDEWQAWLIGRDSRSLFGLFHNFRYDGHPGLWYLALYGVSRFTGDPLALQLLHLTLASAAVWVFLRYSPFTRLQKILFIFGYFPFFEYAVLSRNYAPGVLLLFTYCALYPRKFPRRYLLLAAILFLLCQASVYGVLLALALAVSLACGEFTGHREYLSQHRYEFLAAAGLVLTGVVLSVLQLLPPADSGFATGWRFHFDGPALLRTFGTIWDSYVPLPACTEHWWNTNILSQPYLKLFFSLLLLAGSLLLLRRRPAALLLFVLGALALLSFTYIKYPGSVRHHGHLFLLLLAALWLSAEYPPALTASAGRGAPERWRRIFITLLFSAQLTAGLLAAAWSLTTPFSAGKETAQFIQERQLAGMLLAGDEDDAASVVSGYLNRPIYYLGPERFGTFVIWDQRRQSLKVPEVLQRARQLAARRRQDVLLLLNRPAPGPAPDLLPVRQFTRSIVPAETYYVYILPYPPGPPAP